jgi:hypothetical protein
MHVRGSSTALMAANEEFVAAMLLQIQLQPHVKADSRARQVIC